MKLTFIRINRILVETSHVNETRFYRVFWHLKADKFTRCFGEVKVKGYLCVISNSQYEADVSQQLSVVKATHAELFQSHRRKIALRSFNSLTSALIPSKYYYMSIKPRYHK